LSDNNLKFEIDVDQLTSHLKEFKVEAQKMLEEGVKAASAMTYAKAQELAGQKLRTRLEEYRKALHYREVTQGVWVVELDEKALWIEDGKPAGSMVDDLLRNNPKVNKKGQRYKAIPFDQADGARAEGSEKLTNILNLLKTELKARGIPYKKLETNPDGSPRIGKLHKFNVESPKPTAKASTPALYGVSIYQRETQRGKVQRDIMTFRIVTDEHKREGKWYYPGKEGVKIFEEVYDWVSREWETTILPDIMKKFE
jgi:hypothetical protein